MPRTDKTPVVSERDLTHTIEVDPSIDFFGLSLAQAHYILSEAERPADALLLYMTYKMLYQEHKRVPSIPTLSKTLKWGKEKLTSVRNALKELGLIEDIKIKEDGTGRFIATRTRLRDTGFPAPGKTPSNTLKSINTPDSDKTSSGCVCKDCSCSTKEKKPPKSFPREQDFNSLWSINMHKTNKEDAKKAWKSQPVQKHLPSKDELIEAYEADAEKKGWATADQKHIPYLSTWLRGKCWRNHTGEPASTDGGIHIMQQLKKIDGIEDARQLKAEILDEFPSRAPKKLIRKYVKWLVGSDSPPATDKDSIKDVLVRSRKPESKYWNAFIQAEIVSTPEEF